MLTFPNRSFIGLFAVLLAMWYAGASQSNSAAYLLCFVLIAIAAVSIPDSRSNLKGLEIKPEQIGPVFAGQTLRIPVTIRNNSRRARFALELRAGAAGDVVRVVSVAPGEVVSTELQAPAETRGYFTTVNAVIWSTYPLGFLTARRRLTFSQPYFIYPQAEGDLPLPQTFDPARDTREGARTEGDDYAGTRFWIPGESMRHIDWKAVSRGQPLMTKQWASDAGHRLVLDFQNVAELELEKALSQLARWVVDAENHGLDYGLRLKQVQIPPGRGEAHFHHCLQALTTVPKDSDSA